MTTGKNTPSHDSTRDVPEGLSAIAQAAQENADAGSGLPPVEKWNPPFCGDLDIRITSDGQWHYQNSPIGRVALARLFSTVLRRDEDGRFYLVTPHEKIGITVDDAPFLAVDLERVHAHKDQILRVTTNMGDVVSIDQDHPIRFETCHENGGMKPYIHIRGRLEALLSRAMFYELVRYADTETIDGEDWVGVWSAGVFFPMQRAEELV